MKNFRFLFFAFTLASILAASWSLKSPAGKNKNINSDEKNLIALGRMLFYDPVLSGDNTISCSSCHKQQFAFSDTARFSRGINGKVTKRNAMSLANLRWSDHFFWDGRARSLEEQILFPIQDSLEMGQDLEKLEAELNADAKYKKLIYEIYGTDNIKIPHITASIAAFVKNIYSRNSPVDFVFSSSFATEKSDDITMHDLFKKGIEEFSTQNNVSIDKRVQEAVALKSIRSDNVINAFILCIQCHDKNFFQPEALMKNNGLPARKNDLGLGGVSGKKEEIGLFKVPTLRNISVTPPYMHDGRFSTLKEVVQFYNSGIQYNENLDTLLLKNGKPLRLKLSENEMDELIVFLELLTDTFFLNNPSYSKPAE